MNVNNKRNKCFILLFALIITFATMNLPVFADSYAVSVTPHYRHPITGVIEDPGQNEAIGQGMTESLLNPQGVLETDENGNMYLRVSYNLMSYVTNVGFQIPDQDTYVPVSYDIVQENGDLSEFRFPIPGPNIVVRGTAYIAPMGRDVVYYIAVGAPEGMMGTPQTQVPVETTPDKPAVIPATNPSEINAVSSQSQPSMSPSSTNMQENSRIEQPTKKITEVTSGKDILADAQGTQEISVVTKDVPLATTSSTPQTIIIENKNKTGMVILLTIALVLIVEVIIYLIYKSILHRGERYDD